MRKTRKIDRLTLRAVVIWHLPVAIERNTDLSVLGSLELLAVDFHGVSVSQNDAVANTREESTSKFGRQARGSTSTK